MARDYYKILRVPHTATIKEIKTSYRKLALRFHPDAHGGDPDKTAEFRVVTEAYGVLSDESKKNKYDLKNGFRYNKNRRMPPPPNYRSVEFPKPPKDMKILWDHKLHHDLHYGNGLYELIIEKAKKRMEREGKLKYESPIGEGFEFDKKNPERNKNPYNQGRSSAGGPKVEFIFEEYGFTNLNDIGTSNENLQRRVRVVEDLHGRREQRRQYQSARKETEAKQKKENKAFQREETCVIL